MRKLLLTGLIPCVVLAAATPSFAGVTADEAFETLASLAGTWKGTPEGEGAEAEASAEAAGQSGSSPGPETWEGTRCWRGSSRPSCP